MDDRSKELLGNIVSKTPATLTEDELSFIRARQSYLSETHKSKFEKVLKNKPNTSKSGAVNKNAKNK